MTRPGDLAWAMVAAVFLRLSVFGYCVRVPLVGDAVKASTPAARRPVRSPLRDFSRCSNELARYFRERGLSVKVESVTLAAP
ncbi:MAG: hypothetical protein M3P18_04070 [Actinomycetota bacterium]|nr:hypothetical protein [Actinomycetota bacterium]